MNWTTHCQESGITLAPGVNVYSKFPCYVCRKESTHFYEIIEGGSQPGMIENLYLGMCNEHYLMSFLQNKTYRELQSEELIVFKVMHV